MYRSHAITATALSMVLACMGCTSNVAAPPAEPTSAGTTTRTTPPPTKPASTTAPTVPAHLEKYSAAERRAFHDAVEDYRRFSARQAEINAEGAASRQARRFYRRYTAAWQTYWTALRERESEGIRIEGTGKVLQVRPERIKLDDAGSSIDLRVCGVARGVKVFREGVLQPLPRPKPTTVNVSLVKVPDQDWWRVVHEQGGDSC